MALYTETVMDHFMHPRNVGEIADADGVGEVGNAKCGDIMKMYLKIKDNKIEDVKFETFGCGSAIASSSIATEMIKGRTLEDALALTNQVLSACGKPVLPIESATVEQLVTTGLTVTAALVNWWKNNSFTPEAIKADGYLEQLREKK